MVLCSFFSLNSFGQVAGGAIVGVVTDPTSSVIVGVKVKAKSFETSQTSEASTNEQGYYEFPYLPASRYVLSAELQGFQRATTAEMVLHAGTKPRVDLQMRLGEVSETVEVVDRLPWSTPQPPIWELYSTTGKWKPCPSTVETLSNSSDWSQGVVNRNAEPVGAGSTTGSYGGVEFNGSPALGNNLLLDGVDMSFGESNSVGDQAAGTEAKGAMINTVSVEAIKEFKATSSAFSAEYGRSTGGVINVTTKSGTNQYSRDIVRVFSKRRARCQQLFFQSLGTWKTSKAKPIWRKPRRTHSSRSAIFLF